MRFCFAICFCSFFSAARRTNGESAAAVIGLFARTPTPRSGAAELAPLKQSSPFSLLGCRPRCPINAVLLRNMFLFILLNSEKNERGKRRRGYRAFRSDADASFGGCGTRSAQTVLAFFPPRLSSSLPDKSGLLRDMVFCSFFLTVRRMNGEVSSSLPDKCGFASQYVFCF